MNINKQKTVLPEKTKNVLNNIKSKNYQKRVKSDEIYSNADNDYDRAMNC